MFQKFFGRTTRVAAKAAAAERRGDLVRAAALFAEAGQPDEAARVTILQGDRETRSSERIQHYRRAATLALLGSAAHTDARRKRALAVVAMAAEVPLTRTLRLELVAAAGELEAAGDHADAAEAYARAGDITGQTRALAQAGAVDALEAVLSGELARSRGARNLRDAHEEFGARVARGDRRHALDLARALGDEALLRRARAIENRRISGATVRARVNAREMTVLLGEEIIVGRAPEVSPDTLGRAFAALAVPSSALSRRHIAIARRGGHVFVRDLGSRNGTLCEGRPLAGEHEVSERVELTLGGEVRAVLRTDGPLPKSIAIEIGAVRYVAPLGPTAWLGDGRWRLEAGSDGWVELVTQDDPPAFDGELRMRDRVTLLVGDAIGATRGGAALLVVHDASDAEDRAPSC